MVLSVRGESAIPTTKPPSAMRDTVHSKPGPDIDTEAMLRLWYFATPIFALLDWGLGFTARVAAIESGLGRFFYYVACVACAVVVARWPRLSSWVALTESSVNVGLLFIATASSYFLGPDAVAAGRSPDVMTLPRLVNFLLVGGVLIYSVQRAIWDLRPGASSSAAKLRR